MNARHKLFVEEYIKDKNATAAYQRAGYTATGHSAEMAASRLMRKDEIAAAIEAALAKQVKRVQVSADWVLRKLKKNVQRSMTAVPVLDSEGNEVGRYTYQGAVANKALELLGKHIGLFPTEVKLNVAVEQLDAEIAAELIRIGAGFGCEVEGREASDSGASPSDEVPGCVNESSEMPS